MISHASSFIWFQSSTLWHLCRRRNQRWFISGRSENKENIAVEWITKGLIWQQSGTFFWKEEIIYHRGFSCRKSRVLVVRELQKTLWAIWKANSTQHTRLSVSYVKPTWAHDCKSKERTSCFTLPKRKLSIVKGSRVKSWQSDRV